MALENEARSRTPGIERQTLRTTSRSARPIVALARKPGPKQPDPHSMPISRRTGPFTITAWLAPESALEIHRLLEDRCDVFLDALLPRFGIERFPKCRRLEVDRQDLERREADEKVVRLGVTMDQPARVQGQELIVSIFE